MDNEESTQQESNQIENGEILKEIIDVTIGDFFEESSPIVTTKVEDQLTVAEHKKEASKVDEQNQVSFVEQKSKAESSTTHKSPKIDPKTAKYLAQLTANYEASIAIGAIENSLVRTFTVEKQATSPTNDLEQFDKDKCLGKDQSYGHFVNLCSEDDIVHNQYAAIAALSPTSIEMSKPNYPELCTNPKEYLEWKIQREASINRGRVRKKSSNSKVGSLKKSRFTPN